ncbi:MAG: hypothetical protein WCK26_02175 [Candidatus Saccharibacteria bacterium]
MESTPIDKLINSTENGEQTNKVELLNRVCRYIRRDSFETVRNANSGHIGGPSSSTELLVTMYFGGQFNFDLDDPKNPDRDQVLIRGHEGPVRYPIFALMGYIDRDELSTYRSFGSRLQGHEDMHLVPGVDITPSGSLGMLLSYGVGAAVVNKNEERDGRIVVFLGDGEEQEGNVSEAARHAATLPLDNLICIIDQNEKQLSRPTSDADGSSDISKIWEGYGWDVMEISNGQDVAKVLDVYKQLDSIKKPTVIIAHTTKGYGVEGCEDHFSGYHTISVTDRSALDDAIDGLNTEITESSDDEFIPAIARTLVTEPANNIKRHQYSNDIFKLNYNGPDEANIEDGQTQYLTELGEKIQSDPNAPPLYVLSPDFIKQTTQAKMGFNDFSHFYSTGIREQHTIGMAHGISVTNPDARVYVHYWDAFAYRSLDQMNAAAQGASNILVSGANSGLFQEHNGKTHQTSGQPGALLTVPEITTYEPADVHDLYNVYSRALGQNNGFTYVRVHSQTMRKLEREKDDEDNIDAYIVHKSDKLARFVIASSGALVQNSIDAARVLEIEHGIPTNVINVVNQKTLGEKVSSLLSSDAPILTVYNGNPVILQSSMSKAVMESAQDFRPRYIEGHGFVGGTTGGIEELERHYGLDVGGIVLKALAGISKDGRR